MPPERKAKNERYEQQTQDDAENALAQSLPRSIHREATACVQPVASASFSMSKRDAAGLRIRHLSTPDQSWNRRPQRKSGFGRRQRSSTGYEADIPSDLTPRVQRSSRHAKLPRRIAASGEARGWSCQLAAVFQRCLSRTSEACLHAAAPRALAPGPARTTRLTRSPARSVPRATGPSARGLCASTRRRDPVQSPSGAGSAA